MKIVKNRSAAIAEPSELENTLLDVLQRYDGDYSLNVNYPWWVSLSRFVEEGDDDTSWNGDLPYMLKVAEVLEKLETSAIQLDERLCKQLGLEQGSKLCDAARVLAEQIRRETEKESK